VKKKIAASLGEMLDPLFKEKFSRECETVWDLLSMRLITVPSDGGKFTKEQHAWIAGFSAAWSAKQFGLTSEKELIPKTDADLHRLEEMAERRYAAGDNDSHAILTMAIALIAKHERMIELRARRDRLAKMILRYLDTPLSVKQSIKIEQALREEAK